MHPSIRSLLELDDINRQRQILADRRVEREKALKQAQAVADAAQTKAEAAQLEVDKNGALMRQYQADLERCDGTIEKLRAQQMEATTNKAYLTCINGIEKAKAEKRAREDSILNLQAQVEELQATADAARTEAEAASAKVAELSTANQAQEQADTSEAELDRIYGEKKQGCDPKFLELYERLVKSRNPRPLMKVDPRSRATPMGNCISTNALEALRLGNLVTDPATNSILYVDEDTTREVGEK